MTEEMNGSMSENTDWQVPDAWGGPQEEDEGSINWGEVKRRIAEIEAALGGLEATSPEAVAAVWARRAERLAQAQDEEAGDERIDLLMVRLGAEVFAFDALHVTNVRPLEALTPVPRVPAWVAGVANVSGRIISVIDLRGFLGLPGGNGEAAFLVIAESENMEVGLLVDDVLSVASLRRAAMQAGSQGTRGLPSEYIQSIAEWDGPNGALGIAPGFVVVLELRSILEDERLIIHEEV